MNDRLLMANSPAYLKPIFQEDDLPKNSHAGLVFNKFLNIWEGSYVNPAKKKEIGNTLFAFISNYNQRNTENSDACVLLAELNQRMERQRKCCHMTSMSCEVGWRLALGLGNPNPIENGFDFDPIIGVPVINGTAIKGLCRHAAKEFNHDADESELTRLFGPETIEPGIADPSTGDILFFDALPAVWPRLCVDIINCHHQSYYNQMEKHEQNWPRETEDPVPVFFLAVENKTKFTFRLSSRSRTESDLKKAMDYLRNGLDYYGIGGKTAVGYGTFNEVQ